jgi:murein L,D-transpeptidase YafK
MLPDRSLFQKFAVAAATFTLLAACSDTNPSRMRAAAPIPAKLVAEMKAKGMTRSSPMLVRVYKQESELEIWKQTSGGRYALLKSYPVCRWSGQLGPKKNEGDRQVPEGFYSVSAGQMNPNSKFYLSFDVGYPNAYDRSLGRSGGDIMVHGSCSSRGCFAMTDREIAEIYAVARESLSGGQPAFQVQSYPFRMTAENLVRHRKNPNYGFWRNLKDGADSFEVTKQPVQVAACGSRYVFNGIGGESCNISPPDQSVVAAVLEKGRRDDERIASMASATPAVSYLYEDGGSNPVFASLSVDTKAIPGRDRPYSRVFPPTVVALNDDGRPASDADAHAAAKATYSAAETLLMAEATLARRPSAPQNPAAVSKRQKVVYARLMGKDMPTKAPEPKPQEVAEPAGPAPVVVAAAEPDDEGSFIDRWLGFAEEEPAAKVKAVSPIKMAAAKPSLSQPSPAKDSSAKPVVAPQAPKMAAAASSPRAEEEQPFYRRWLGLGSDEDEALARDSSRGEASPETPATGSIPIPPARRQPSSARFTSLSDAF